MYIYIFLAVCVYVLYIQMHLCVYVCVWTHMYTHTEGEREEDISELKKIIPVQMINREIKNIK